MKKLETKQTDILEAIKHWMGRILLIACVLEMFFFPSEENLVGCVSLIYGWFLISSFAIRRKYLKQYVLPTMVMFGLGFCYFFLPILVTLVEGKPLTFNFQVPYLTFFNQMISVTVITLAFRWALKVYKPKCVLNRFWNKVGYMTVLSEKEIWIIGVIGLIALLSIVSGQGAEREFQGTGNAAAIVVRVLSSFAMAPVCIYFKRLYGDNSPTTTRPYVKYYIIILMIIGLATTRRMMIFNSVVTIALIYVFLLLYNNRNSLFRKNVIITFLGGFLVMGPLADLAMAMILNRQLVYSTNATDTMKKVWNLYQDKERLHSAYQYFMATTDNGGNNQNGWSEYYVNNIFLDRFCNLRTIDGTLYNAKKAGFGCDEGLEYYKDFWINELPSPIANSMGYVKKFQGTAVDHMVVSNFNDYRYSLFGFKVGGETGIGLWMFGYLYYPIAFITYFLVFYFLCSIVNAGYGVLMIPLPVLVNFRLYWMFFINANGIFTSMGSTFTRNNLNTIIIYSLLVFVMHLFFRKKKVYGRV